MEGSRTWNTSGDDTTPSGATYARMGRDSWDISRLGMGMGMGFWGDQVSGRHNAHIPERTSSRD